MKRIEYLRIDEMSADQLALYKEIVNGPRGAVIGPLKIWLNNPRFATSAQAVGKYARYENSLP
jgi:4-carboxymuconolactone decarboxylase